MLPLNKHREELRTRVQKGDLKLNEKEDMLKKIDEITYTL
jgi:hypothetical protein